MLMSILSLALATAVIDGQIAHGPEPLSDPDLLILIADFPAAAPEGEQAWVSYRLIIDPFGAIVECSGRDAMRPPSEQAASPYVARTCDLLRERARFRPATDDRGQAISGEYLHHAGWARTDAGAGRMITTTLPSWPQERVERVAPPSPPPRSATLRTDLVPHVARTYPSRALREGIEGTVQYAVVVGPDGRVTACSIQESSGSALLDERTCDVLQRYARYDPAIDNRGQLTSDRLFGIIEWQLPIPTAIPAPTASD